MKRRNAVKSITAFLGYNMSPVAITALVGSCKKEQKAAGWKPYFFAEADLPILAKLGEAFLPRTHTPGAIDVAAHLFVDAFLGQAATLQDRETIKRGYEAWKSDFKRVVGTSIEEASQQAFMRNLEVYYKKSDAEMEEIRQLLAKEIPSGGTEVKKYLVYKFLGKFKPLLMLGYYASEEIGEKVLSYLPVPGEYEGCIPVSTVGNAWSIN